MESVLEAVHHFLIIDDIVVFQLVLSRIQYGFFNSDINLYGFKAILIGDLFGFQVIFSSNLVIIIAPEIFQAHIPESSAASSDLIFCQFFLPIFAGLDVGT